VVRESCPHLFVFDSESEYFDAKSSDDKQNWFCEKTQRVISLSVMKKVPEFENVTLAKHGGCLPVKLNGRRYSKKNCS